MQALDVASAPNPVRESVATTSPKWLPWLRVVWILVTLNAISVFGWMVYFTRQFSDHLPARIAEGLSTLNWTNDFYFWFHVAFMALSFLCFFVIGSLIFLLRPQERMAWFASVLLIALGGEIAYPLAVEFTTIWATAPVAFGVSYFVNNLFSWGFLGAFLALFPNGQFVPKWSRYVALFGFCFSFGFGIFPSQFIVAAGPLFVVVIAGGLTLFGGSLYAQVWRYRHYSTPLQKQQTKWLIYALALIVMFVFVVSSAIYIVLPGQQVTTAAGVIVDLIYFLANLSFILLPLAIGIAIVRYRLWDVEILIRRTLVYVPLTAMIAGIFAASITLSQKFFVAITGATSDAATVLTTLIVVALFDPLKIGLQHLVDRRFKEAADPAKELQAFGDQVRAVVQVLRIEQLAQRLADTATRAFNAQGGAVILGDGVNSKMAFTSKDWNGETRLSVPLEVDGKPLGQLKLGARRNGADYTERDREMLQQIAGIVGQALEQDDARGRDAMA